MEVEEEERSTCSLLMLSRKPGVTVSGCHGVTVSQILGIMVSQCHGFMAGLPPEILDLSPF